MSEATIVEMFQEVEDELQTQGYTVYPIDGEAFKVEIPYYGPPFTFEFVWPEPPGPFQCIDDIEDWWHNVALPLIEEAEDKEYDLYMEEENG